MPDILAQALALPGLGWLIAAAFVAGAVRGFAGFGTAMIYMPVAAQVLPPLWAIITLVVMDLFGPLPNIPAAMRVANRGDLARLLLGTLLTLPLGLWALGYLPPDVFRSIVSGIALAMLGFLLTGFRYHGPMGPGLVLGTGGLAGFLGGISGQPGPPVILLYLASPSPAPVVRASTMAYLFLFDILILVVLAMQRVLVTLPVVVGLVLAMPNLAGNLAGALIFRPGYERIYRATAYAIIAASALSGLPIWG